MLNKILFFPVIVTNLFLNRNGLSPTRNKQSNKNRKHIMFGKNEAVRGHTEFCRILYLKAWSSYEQFLFYNFLTFKREFYVGGPPPSLLF